MVAEHDRADVDARTGTAGESPGGLASVVRRGAVISTATLVVVQLVSLVSTLWLARLLTPAEVGLFAAGTVLCTFLVSAAEGSLRAALVQWQGDVDDAADTVFWATAAGGLLMSLLALAAAPLLGWFFESDVVTAVAAATAGLLLLESLTNVPDGLMQRRFNFKRRLIIDPTRAVAFPVVALPLAAAGFGVWAMVIGQYAAVVVWLVGTWLLARWRPGRGRPSVRLWRSMARFAYPLLLQDVVLYIRDMVQTAVTGRRLGATALGHYRYGNRLGMLPGFALVEIASYVLFPAFSRMADQPERLRAAFLRSLTWIWFAAVPVAALVIAIGEPVVVVLLGEPWRGAGVFLVAMAGYGVGLALQSVATEVIKARGRSSLFHWTSALELLLGIGLILLLIPYGLVGVGIAVSVTEIAIGLVLVGFAREVTGCSLGDLLGALVPPLLAGTVALASVQTVLSPGLMWPQLGDGIGGVVVEAVALGSVFLVVSLVVHRGFRDVLRTVVRPDRREPDPMDGEDAGRK